MKPVAALLACLALTGCEPVPPLAPDVALPTQALVGPWESEDLEQYFFDEYGSFQRSAPEGEGRNLWMGDYVYDGELLSVRVTRYQPWGGQAHGVTPQIIQFAVIVADDRETFTLDTGNEQKVFRKLWL